MWNKLILVNVQCPNTIVQDCSCIKTHAHKLKIILGALLRVGFPRLEKVYST